MFSSRPAALSPTHTPAAASHTAEAAGVALITLVVVGRMATAVV